MLSRSGRNVCQGYTHPVLRLVTRRMAAKIFLAIGLAVGTALLVQAWFDANRSARGLEQSTRDSASQAARLVVSGIEHAMLAGEGIEVKRLVARFKRQLGSSARVQIYDKRGIEVFASPAPPPATVRDDLASAMTTGRAARAADGAVIAPIASEERCAPCHRREDEVARFPRVRGALEMALSPAPCRGDDRKQLLRDLVERGFVHIMTAKQSDLLPDYFATLGTLDGVRAVAVYDGDGDVSFGEAIDGVDTAAVKALFADPGGGRRDHHRVRLTPLLMEQRCVECHDDEPGRVRGVLALSLAAAEEACDEDEVVAVVETSLRYIMLSALGRQIADFLDAAAATEVIERLALYDNQGRQYWTTRHPAPPPAIGEVLRDGRAVVELSGRGAGEMVTVVEPLVNQEGCRRCHGSDMTLRGAVSVGLSTAAAAAARADRMRDSYWFTGYTLAGILLILLALVQYLVVRPVSRIGDVADRVGRGDLDAQVAGADPDGDEIKRLGTRINEMVRGLRAKTRLEKFVSRGAAAHAHDTEGALAQGARRDVTVLFSDIRGFTAFSEDRQPEEVVDMLNRLLRAQAEVVAACGGDIDKYVGDELMAVFYGDDAAARAVACAVAMVEAVEAARKRDLQVGIGINCGDVVYGAIGHEERMDFTVIGDAVNTAARLCSAAGAGEVLVSGALVDAAGDVEGVDFVAGKPIALKGKKKPFGVFRARRTPARE